MKPVRPARPKQTTLADVAQASGVDVSTASRILRDEPGYRAAADTRDKVLAVAKSMNYKVNVIARSLRTARTHTLGIAVPQLENPVFPQLIFGAEAAARERGYSLLISHVTENEADDLIYDKLARIAHVDGLLVATLGEDEVLGQALRKVSQPVVVLNRKISGVPNYAVLDSFAAAQMATQFLLDQGHRRIAHLAGRLQGYNGTQRLAGFKAALAAANVEFDPAMVAAGGYSFEGGMQAMGQLLKGAYHCSAVFAATMLTAAGAIKVLHAQGIAVPQDVSVIGIHDAPMADMLHPPLTTVRMPLYALGHAAAVGLMDLIEGRADRLELILPPDGVVVRGSTTPLQG